MILLTNHTRRQVPFAQEPLGLFSRPAADWWPKGRRPTRDVTRRRCYAAEHVFETNRPHYSFETLEEAGRWLEKVIWTKWFQRRWPRFDALGLEAKGGGICQAWALQRTQEGFPISGKIQMSDWGLGQSFNPRHPRVDARVILLHELAHCLCPRDGHGRRWRRTYIELVSLAIGREEGRALRAAFAAAKLKLSPYRVVAEGCAARRPPVRGRKDES